MSGKSRRVNHPPGRTDTLIGAGLRVEGNIASTGVLRILGDVHGDVSCDADSVGTVVVDKPGSVAGAVKARHIIVSGQVTGPLHSSESIEIQQGAHIAGDAFYRDIEIQPGGILEGTLTPCGEPDGDRLPQAHRLPMPGPAAAKGPGGRRRTAAALALVAVAFTVAMLYRSPAPMAPSAADSAPAADAAAAKTPAPAEGAGPQDGQRSVATNAPAPAVTDANARPDAQASPPERPEADAEQAVKVQGVNPGKPAGFFLLVGREPSVLYRKKRQDPGEGARIDVAQGATISIAVAKDEIVRVAEGRQIEIFYQGRKVAPKTIESGAWMSFVPQSPQAASGRP